MLPILNQTIPTPVLPSVPKARPLPVNFTNGIPPQVPLSVAIRNAIPAKPLPRAGRVKTFGVELRRGFYPGQAWGELLVCEDQRWDNHQRDRFMVVEACLPDFTGGNFRPMEVKEFRVPMDEDRPWYSYHIMEIASNTVSGAQYRIRSLHGEVWRHWRRLKPGCFPLYVNEEIQPPLAVVTGVMFKLVKQLEAERQREAEQLERARLKETRRRQNNQRPFRI